MGKRISIKDRLLRKSTSTPNGCLEWTGAIKSNGYGNMPIGSTKDGSRRTVAVHRAAYEEWNGPIGDNWVLHSCDNKKCINPKHLYLGDRKQNIKDAIDRGLLPPQQGEKNGNAAISEYTARRIKWLLSRNTRQIDIARGLGVSSGIVHSISSGLRWSHLPEPTPTLKEPT